MRNFHTPIWYWFDFIRLNLSYWFQGMTKFSNSVLFWDQEKMTALWVLVIRFAPGKVNNATHRACKTLKLITFLKVISIFLWEERILKHTVLPLSESGKIIYFIIIFLPSWIKICELNKLRKYFFSQKFNQTKFIIIRIFILSQVEFRVKQVVDELRKNTSLIVRVRPG